MQQDQKNILLKQMSDDPAVFLKRKFNMQYQKLRKNRKVQELKNKW